jgi:hypothetical protein
MAEKGQKTPRRPFHESVIEAINRPSSGKTRALHRMDCLADLIKTTKIPAGHDEIIEAWKKRCQELSWSEESFGVIADLLEQKREAAKKEKAKAQKKAES